MSDDGTHVSYPSDAPDPEADRPTPWQESMLHAPRIERPPDASHINALRQEYRYHFANDYRVSVLNSPTTPGFREGLWELVVLSRSDDEDYHPVFDTPVADDVLSGLTDGDVGYVLNQVEALPRRRWMVKVRIPIDAKTAAEWYVNANVVDAEGPLEIDQPVIAYDPNTTTCWDARVIRISDLGRVYLAIAWDSERDDTP